MLFINDDEPKAMKLHLLLDECMSPYDHMRLSILNLSGYGRPFLFLGPAGQKDRGEAHLSQHGFQREVMLFR